MRWLSRSVGVQECRGLGRGQGCLAEQSSAMKVFFASCREDMDAPPCYPTSISNKSNMLCACVKARLRNGTPSSPSLKAYICIV